MVEFKIIKEFPKYSINNTGTVINNISGYILKFIIRDGYYVVNLKHNGKTKTTPIHRLVARYFVPNPDFKTCVNHIDGNKLNNNYNNLEWVTVAENTIHAYENNLSSLNVVLELTNIETNETIKVRSIQHAAGIIGIHMKSIISYMKYSNKYPFMGKYIFRILDINKFNNNLNSSNFGKKCYLYDYLTKEFKEYSSIGLLMYDTALRTPFKLHPSFLEKLGYILSLYPITEIPILKYELKEIKNNRNRYISKEYLPTITKLAVVDLLSNDLKIKYLAKKDFQKFIINKFGESYLIKNIGSKRRLSNKNNLLIRGYLVHLYNDKDEIVEWDTFTLEEAVNSRLGRCLKSHVYDIFINSEKIRIYSLHKLLNYLKPFMINDKILKMQYSKIKITDILNSIGNNPLINIVKLSDIVIKI